MKKVRLALYDLSGPAIESVTELLRNNHVRHSFSGIDLDSTIDESIL